MTGGEPPVVLAVDSGGSGMRVVLARGTEVLGEPAASGEPVRTGARGIDAGHLLERLLPLARRLLDDAGCEHPAAVAVGAAGFATLGEQLRAELPSALSRELGVRRIALVADAVTAYTGALGVRPGAVIAAGTGLIAIGTDLESWRRADGWGHLLGDCGGGAWIGRAGLEAALRAYDGRTGGSARLLARAEEVFGPMDGLPGGSTRGRTGRRSSRRSHPRWPPAPWTTRWRRRSCAMRPGTWPTRRPPSARPRASPEWP